eukprot:Phypoly_transcript_18990.p1 GENE.Phypoly_transcript_18990~~Phypoly_transcript_18990.p1  ORF type:complete len:215 (+),score=7.98 Phypoly_transcript_18990:85-729(+)
MKSIFIVILVVVSFLQAIQAVTYILRQDYVMSKDCGGTVSEFHFDQIDVCLPFERFGLIYSYNVSFFTFTNYTAPDCTGTVTNVTQYQFGTCYPEIEDKLIISRSYLVATSLDVPVSGNAYQVSHYPSCSDTSALPLMRNIQNPSFCFPGNQLIDSYMFSGCNSTTAIYSYWGSSTTCAGAPTQKFQLIWALAWNFLVLAMLLNVTSHNCTFSV